MSTNASTPNRSPLDYKALAARVSDDGPYARVVYTRETGSTNSDAAAAGRADDPEWTAFVTDCQTSGKGRKNRAWSTPDCSQVTLSVLLRPSSSVLPRLGLLPLITGLAVVDALRAHSVDAVLKWPNDVLLNGKKLCGILGEAVALGDKPVLVMGLGCNVSLREDELPVPHATSLYLQGYEIDRTELVADILLALHRRLFQWMLGGGELADALREYREVCASIGSDVRVHVGDGSTLLGVCTGVDREGHILVTDDEGQEHQLSAGDVEHLRPQEGQY